MLIISLSVLWLGSGRWSCSRWCAAAVSATCCMQDMTVDKYSSRNRKVMVVESSSPWERLNRWVLFYVFVVPFVGIKFYVQVALKFCGSFVSLYAFSLFNLPALDDLWLYDNFVKDTCFSLCVQIFLQIGYDKKLSTDSVNELNRSRLACRATLLQDRECLPRRTNARGKLLCFVSVCTFSRGVS